MVSVIELRRNGPRCPMQGPLTAGYQGRSLLKAAPPDGCNNHGSVPERRGPLKGGERYGEIPDELESAGRWHRAAEPR
jgi:hypothetical protein